jgi:hypothetical protein
LNGCSATTSGRLHDAGAAIGAARAGVNLPAQPEECGKDEPHAPIRKGDEARAVIDRARAALDRANGSKRRCYLFNEDLRRNLAGAPS